MTSSFARGLRVAAATLLLTAACVPPPTVAPADAALEGPIWTLVELGGHPVSVGPDGRLPHLQLVAGARQLQGYGGCNRLSGRYEHTGAALRFPALAMTRMACPKTMQLEQAFVTTLEATDSFRIADGTLELIAGGKARARLQVTP